MISRMLALTVTSFVAAGCQSGRPAAGSSGSVSTRAVTAAETTSMGSAPAKAQTVAEAGFFITRTVLVPGAKYETAQNILFEYGPATLPDGRVRDFQGLVGQYDPRAVVPGSATITYQSAIPSMKLVDGFALVVGQQPVVVSTKLKTASAGTTFVHWVQPLQGRRPYSEVIVALDAHPASPVLVSRVDANGVPIGTTIATLPEGTYVKITDAAGPYQVLPVPTDPTDEVFKFLQYVEARRVAANVPLIAPQ